MKAWANYFESHPKQKWDGERGQRDGYLRVWDRDDATNKGGDEYEHPQSGECKTCLTNQGQEIHPPSRREQKT